MTLYGPDVSHFQGNVNWGQVKAEGFSFAIAKCTEGTGWVDASYAANLAGARANGLLFAAYHYVSTENAAAQADNLVRHIGDKRVPVMIDHEKGSGNEANNLAVAQAIRARGMTVILNYLPHWYWTSIGSPGIRTGPLSASHYASTTPAYASVTYRGVTPTYWSGYGGQTVAVLQFTDAALIAGQRMDCNAYPGTVAQLTQLFHGQLQEAPMALTDADAATFWGHQIATPGWTHPDGTPWPDRTMPASVILGWTDDRNNKVIAAIADLTAKVDALAAPAAVDPAALAAALAPTLSAHLPAITDADVAKIAAAAAAELARRLAA